ncbi:alkene reductase [Zooshikella ganghwensis]|uniref:Alkene reductase n=1 Tax=Zooshikella ganghwensis TaxID=202772 RepID=A0A4P9VUY6_9GAMM|nr:alkene reductase [Zooshikella ganghwensis]RDH46162.1 alkene reductase [Zooshikella ganghwensis]
MAKSPLLTPFQLGDITLPNRVIMAPLTRSRASQPGDIPNQLMVEYYRQRATSGLIITEASQISPQGKGYACTPGIYSDEQVEGWKAVTKAVHQEGGKIALQLWHVGRISNRILQPENQLPVAPSAIKAEGARSYNLINGKLTRISTDLPKALTVEEIKGIQADYVNAAINAMKAGFDMVELHAANGYLPDQFLAKNSNQRTDEYGGSIENRARFLLETADKMIEQFEPGKLGVRLSPMGTFNDIDDDEADEVALYVASELNKRKIAYLHLNEPTWANGQPYSNIFRDKLRQSFKGAIIVCGAYDRDRAEEVVTSGWADLVAFGRPYIANPDLVNRFKYNSELNEPDPDTFYGGDAKGYIDYPMFETTAV